MLVKVPVPQVRTAVSLHSRSHLLRLQDILHPPHIMRALHPQPLPHHPLHRDLPLSILALFQLLPLHRRLPLNLLLLPLLNLPPLSPLNRPPLLYSLPVISAAYSQAV